MRRFSIDPGVACAIATSPRTPQLPPCPQGGPPCGLEIALATTAPILKKLPPVAAVPIRKKRGSDPFAARHAVAMYRATMKAPLTRATPRQPHLRIWIIVSHGEPLDMAHASSAIATSPLRGVPSQIPISLATDSA